MNLNKKNKQKHSYQIITAILLLIFCISGCKNIKKSNKKKETFDSIQVEKGTHLSNDTTTPIDKSAKLTVDSTSINKNKITVDSTSIDKNEKLTVDSKAIDRIKDLTLGSIKIEKRAYLYNDTTMPTDKINVDFTYIKSAKSKGFSDSLNSHFMELAFDETYTKGNLEFIINRFADDFVNRYKSDAEPKSHEEKRKDYEACTRSNEIISAQVQFFNNSYFSYRCYKYSKVEDNYGAHDSYHMSFLNVDLINNKIISLKDIFVKNYRPALTDLIWEQLMADKNVSSREDLLALDYGHGMKYLCDNDQTGKDIKPTENFFLTKEGITFFYNVYEIAPCSMGATKLTLPYKAIHHLLNKKSPIVKELID